MSKKNQVQYICSVCHHLVNKWLGRCPECQTWNSFQEEFLSQKTITTNIQEIDDIAKSLCEIHEVSSSRLKSEIAEFDQVVGGGLIRGSFVLCAGEPGIGKSTLVLNLLGAYANQLKEEKLLYVSGEESIAQVGARAQRLAINHENILLLNEVLWQTVERSLKKHKPSFLVIDSIQTIFSHDVESAPGSPTQIKEMAFQLLNYAKKNQAICIVIGHITKEGSIAGPKLLEHIVDTVLTVEGDPKNEHRILRCSKNRFGKTHQIGLFEMNKSGLKGIDHLINRPMTNSDEVIGCAHTLIKEGQRLLALEIQALVIENKYTYGKRVSQGLDSNHLALLIAIIEKYLGLKLNSDDIYLDIQGGIKLQGRESDLAIIAAILSSKFNKPICARTIFMGETNLAGTIKGHGGLSQRLTELKSWGYESLVSGKATKKREDSLHGLEVYNFQKVEELNKYFSNSKDRVS